jgi:hypothetical protein
VAYPINLQATGTFSDNVTLSAAGLPAGATASFGTNPAFVDSSLASGSTLWITTDSTVQPNNYTITINATSSTGAGPANPAPVTVNLNVSSSTSRDFSLKLTPSTQYVSAGNYVIYKVDTLPINGFSNPITLSASTVPGAVALGWSLSATGPAATTTAQNPTINVNPGQSAYLTVQTASTNPPGSYAVTVTGTSGSLAHTTAGTLDIDLFTAKGSTSTPLYPGGPAQPINVTLKDPYNYAVTVTGLVASVAAEPNGDAIDVSGNDIPNCSASWFTVTPSSISSANTVGLSGNGQVTLGTTSSMAPKISMTNTSQPQDGCHGANLMLNLVGSAQK